MKYNVKHVLKNWELKDMPEVILDNPDDFLRIMETLTRIGILSKEKETLTQTCHILHKKGKYYIPHFKEMFILDEKKSSLTIEDVQRRNYIITMLYKWNLITDFEVGNDSFLYGVYKNGLKVLSFADKDKYSLQQKYTISTFSK